MYAFMLSCTIEEECPLERSHKAWLQVVSGDVPVCDVCVSMHAGAENTMGHNVNQPPGGMYYVNVFLHPFNFSKPEFFIREGHVPAGFLEDEKFIGVWKLPALGLGDGQYFNMPQETYTKADTSLVYTMDIATPPPPV